MPLMTHDGIIPNSIYSAQQHLEEPDGILVGTVAIVGGITSRGLQINAKKQELQKKCPLFNIFLPTFCQTYSSGFAYHFYLAYDADDLVFTVPQQRDKFEQVFWSIVKAMCHRNSSVFLHWLHCDHSHKPAWAQNDAIMQAYVDGMQYFYRINDDTKFITDGWTEIFIEALKKFDPPNVGVVGPNHRGGNEADLTYDFTHHSHQNIFGFHYPKVFPDWTADVWITHVYRPGRSHKLLDVHLDHTMQMGMRYKKHTKFYRLHSMLPEQKNMIASYAVYKSLPPPTPNRSLVIVMAIYNDELSQIRGAMRNIQLAPLIYPGWLIKVYICADRVPAAYVNKYRSLGAEVVMVNTTTSSLSSKYCFLPELTDRHVDALLVRDVTCRLNEREKAAVDAWMTSSRLLHCMRDHDNQTMEPLTYGLYGVRASRLKRFSNEMLGGQSVEKYLWRQYSHSALCHDSVGSGQWSRVAFPADSRAVDYVGQQYDADMQKIEA